MSEERRIDPNKKDKDYDFGFTTYYEEDFKSAGSEEYNKTMQDIRDLILPLLQNLEKDSDKPVIKWPNRGPLLQKKIAEFRRLTEFK